jgi:hypothetical protein
LQIQRKQGIRVFATKLLEIKKKISNLNISNHMLLKNLIEIEKTLFFLKKKKKVIKTNKKKTFLYNNFVIYQILKEYGAILKVLFYDIKYIHNKINYFKIKWPIKITKPLNIPDIILSKAIKQNNTEKKLIVILNYLQKNQVKTVSSKNSIVLTKKLSQKIPNCAVKIEKYKLKKKFLSISANINNIYIKLKKNGILKFNKTQACSRTKIFLHNDYKILCYFKSLTIKLLNFYQYCNNFYNVKNIINYFIIKALILTLKQKTHNLKNIFLKQKNNTISRYSLYIYKTVTFFSRYEVNS